MIRRIDFNCRSLERRAPARVDIAADIGRYRADWRRSPDWDRMWSRMFNWGDDRYGDNRSSGRPCAGRSDRLGGWITLGTEVFNGRTDREIHVRRFCRTQCRNVSRSAP